MNPPRFTFLLNAAQTETLRQAVELLERELGRVLAVRAFPVSDLEEERLSAEEVRRALTEADVVLLDIRGGGRAAGLAAATLAHTRQPVLVLVGGSPEMLRLVRLGSFALGDLLGRREAKPSGGHPFSLQRLQQLMRLIEKGGSLLPWGRLRHARNWARAVRYWTHGGPENLKNLLIFLAREYAGLKLPKPAPPREYPEFGIYDPLRGGYYQEVRAYFRAVGHDPAKPTVGLLFYGGMHFDQSLVPARALARELQERHGLQILPVFATAGHNLTALRQFFLTGGRPLIDALVYFQWFQLTTFSDHAPEEALQLLKTLDVPVFNAAPLYGRDIARWRETEQGLSPVEVLTAVILPELDGMIEPLPTAGLTEQESGLLGGMVRRVAPIPDRVARLAARIAAWIRLRRTPPEKRRVAFLIYDYPPGEDNLGSAAYLDVFASLERLFMAMQEAGYRVEGIPPAGHLPEMLLSRGLVNDPRWSGERRGLALEPEAYEDLWRRLPAAGEVSGVWGPPPGEIMVEEGLLRLPVLEFGNVLLGVQPARGYHADPAKLSHDKSLPPHHQYVAFYRWLEEKWRPHAVVHGGTHGTLEFLKGKEVGVSDTCWPEILLGNVPHLYFYHVVNASEAVVAKRRSLGVLVNYSSPSFTTAGLYEDYAALDDLIAEYYEAKALDPGRAERLAGRIRGQARSLHLPGETVAEIQEELALMQRAIIPKGLHILGQEPTEAERLEYAAFLLRYDREEAPSLHRLLAARQGWDYRELLKAPRGEGGGEAAHRLAAVDREVQELLAAAQATGELPADPELARAARFGLTAAAALGGQGEIPAFLQGLAGGYLVPGLGGDPVRTPEVLPTGRNSYQFDPRYIPSEEALRRGREIAENTLRQYFSRHGAYPRSTGVILWGFETTKTRGETVGQILAYLGVDLEAEANPWYKRVRAIPLEELGRPRVDCLVQICGFFRDMFPNVLDLLNRAFELVSGLEEPEEMNFIRAQTQRMAESLRGRVPESRLPKLALGRIFGPRPGEYGTRTIPLIEAGAWQREEEIARLFIENMAHLYAPNISGEALPEVYRSRLRQVELVSQVRDSHEYEISDLDHYYEFFGGLALSVETVRGSRPEMLISDTTREVIRTEPVREAINRGVRTRLLNPVWIEELLRHDFHGAQKISDRVEYLLGFAVTTKAVESWVFSAVTARYVKDEALFQRLAQNNRFAAEALLKRLAEAAQRGYWRATEEELAALRERYLDLEGLIEEKMES
jgi:cobaltochelatase CobN